MEGDYQRKLDDIELTRVGRGGWPKPTGGGEYQGKWGYVELTRVDKAGWPKPTGRENTRDNGVM